MYAAYQLGQSASRWPVRFVLAVGGLGTSKRARQIARQPECRLGRVDPARQPRRDLLQQPAVAVRIAEGGEGTVGGVIGRGPGDPAVRAEVEDFAHLHAAPRQLVAGRRFPSSSSLRTRMQCVRPRLLERGAVECLFKPFSETALLDALRAALRAA